MKSKKTKSFVFILVCFFCCCLIWSTKNNLAIASSLDLIDENNNNENNKDTDNIISTTATHLVLIENLFNKLIDEQALQLNQKKVFIADLLSESWSGKCEIECPNNGNSF